MRLPEYPRPGSRQPVEQSIKQIIDYLRAITLTSVNGGKLRQSTSGTTLSINPARQRPQPGRKLMPFEVTLYGETDAESEEVSWKVTVADGYVNERIPGGEGDALIAHVPENIRLGDAAVPPQQASDRIPFAVTENQQVSLIVEVDEKGAIESAGEEDAVRVVIEDIDEESVHYVPKIGDASTGEAGTYHYKLATIEPPTEPGGPLKLVLFLSGSHISHFRELPLLVNLPETATSGTGRIVKEYDKDSNEYRFRSIAKGDGQLRVDEDGDNVTVRGNGVAATLRYQIEGESAVDIAEFEDGLLVTEEPVTIQIPTPTLPDDGWWGTLLFEHFAENGDTTPYQALELTIENGRIIAVAEQLPGESMEPVTGTEATPGTGLFASYAEP